jgi:universal stress protein E
MAVNFKKVLVAVKPGRKDLPISVYHATLLARRLGAELRLFSCVYDGQIAAGLVAQDPQAFTAQMGLLDGERRSLKRLGQSLTEADQTIDAAVRWGHPAQDAIAAEAREWSANLLVVGVHRHDRMRLAEVNRRLMMRSPCPLLIMKNAYFTGYAKLLACIDPLRRHAEPAGLDDTVLEVSSGLANSLQAELSVIHAYPPPEDFELASSVEVSPGFLYGSENIVNAHEHAVVELMETHGLSRAQAHLKPGLPEAVLPHEVRLQAADLVIIGSIKRGWIEHMLLGSTAEKVAGDTDCDLLFVGGGR